MSSMDMYRKISLALADLEGFEVREHNKRFTVAKPAWELLYDGRYRYGSGWANRWLVEVWGGRDDVEHTQARLAVAVESVTNALLDIDSIEFDEVRVMTEIPEGSKVRFTHAEIPIRELCVNG